VAEDKRLAKFEDAFSTVIEETIRSTPELAQNYKSIKPFLTKIAKQVFRTAASIDEEGHYKYRDVESATKSFTQKAVGRIGKEFNLSPKSIKKLGAVISGITSLVKKGQVEIPPQKVVDREDITVEAGGYANIVHDIYTANLAGKIKNPFGSGIDITGGAAVSYTPEGVSIDQARIGAEAPFLGGTLSGEVSGNPYEQQARVNYTLPFKKGGKVKKKRKKRKTKKYTKGCVVRTAKY